MKLSDRITGLFLLILGIAVYYGGSLLPPVPGQQVGPSAFPMVIGTGLAFTGLLIFFGVGRGFEEEAEAELAAHGGADLEADAYAASRRWHAFVPPALLVFYYFVSEKLGFVPTAAIMIAILAFMLKAKRLHILPVAILGAVAIQFVFVKILRVPLPPGLLPMPW